MVSRYHIRSPSPQPPGLRSPSPQPPEHRSPSPQPPGHSPLLPQPSPARSPALEPIPRYPRRNRPPVRYTTPPPTRTRDALELPVQHERRSKRVRDGQRKRGLSTRAREALEEHGDSNPPEEPDSDPRRRKRQRQREPDEPEQHSRSPSSAPLPPPIILRIPHPSQRPPPLPASASSSSLPSPTPSPPPAPRPLPDFVRNLVPPRPVAVIEINRRTPSPPPKPKPPRPALEWLNPFLPPQRPRHRGKSVDEFRAFVKRTNEGIEWDRLDPAPIPSERLHAISSVKVSEEHGRQRTGSNAHQAATPVSRPTRPSKPRAFKFRQPFPTSLPHRGTIARRMQRRPGPSPPSHFFVGRQDAPPFVFRVRPPFIAPRRNMRWSMFGEMSEGEYLAEIGVRAARSKAGRESRRVHEHSSSNSRHGAAALNAGAKLGALQVVAKQDAWQRRFWA